MKKRSIAVILVLCVSVAAGIMLNEIFGNPVSKFLVKRSVSEYLEENYSDTDFIIEKVGYDFKNMEYYARVMSSSKPKEHFYIKTDSIGQSIDDNYDLYFNENGVYLVGLESDEEVIGETNVPGRNGESEKIYIDTLDEFDYDGPFAITTNPGECNNKFFVCDKGLEPTADTEKFLFGITYTDKEENATGTVAVVSADYDTQWDDSEVDIEAKIIASNKESVIFEIRYPPLGNSYSYYYNMNTNKFIELQDGNIRPAGNEWYVFKDMFICTTLTLAVGTEMELYAYNWDGDLLYIREKLLSGYTVSDEWVYFSDETNESETEKRCTVYKMNIDGREETEYYSVCVQQNADFTISDDAIIWWENGEQKALDLFTLQPID